MKVSAKLEEDFKWQLGDLLKEYKDVVEGKGMYNIFAWLQHLQSSKNGLGRRGENNIHKRMGCARSHYDDVQVKKNTDHFSRKGLRNLL